jgi:DNA-binding transcriptional ArsR family regulator
MSHKNRKRLTAKPKARARVFAALGDKTRLLLVAKLCAGEPCSITHLSEDSKITRQAITKHLRVLERAGIVRSAHSGRERLFEFDPEPLEGLKEYLDFVSGQWDKARSRLKSSAEK